eukprot:3775146-Amphidinium_carterae.1
MQQFHDIKKAAFVIAAFRGPQRSSSPAGGPHKERAPRVFLLQLHRLQSDQHGRLHPVSSCWVPAACRPAPVSWRGRTLQGLVPLAGFCFWRDCTSSC